MPANTKTAKATTAKTPKAEESYMSQMVMMATNLLAGWGKTVGVDDADLKGIKAYAEAQIRGKSKSAPSADQELYLLLNTTAKRHAIICPLDLRETIKDSLTDQGVSSTEKKIKSKWEGLDFAEKDLEQVKEVLVDYTLNELPAKDFTGPEWQAKEKTLAKKPVAKNKTKALAPAKSVELKTNKWGNLWDPKSKLVFFDAKKGLRICLGSQDEKAKINKDTKEEPLSTVVPLEDDFEVPDLGFKFEVLSEEVVGKCPKKVQERLNDLFYGDDDSEGEEDGDDGEDSEGDEEVEAEESE